MLSFAEESAAAAASQDSLRIFGMIVRGHSLRSFPANDFKRLYVENIASADSEKALSAAEIEYRLSELLSPDLFVSLDINSRSDRRKKAGSFEIIFPSFEVAYDAFIRLNEDLDFVKNDEECTINWIKTPEDALKYWKRELGGVL